MNKDELLAELCARTGLSRRRAERAVQAIFDALGERLRRGERVEVRGFGNFVVRDSAAHAGHHPRTGAPRAVPAQRCALFRPSKALRAALAAATAARTSGAPYAARPAPDGGASAGPDLPQAGGPGASADDAP